MANEGGIPPVQLKISAAGVAEARAALKSIKDATIDAARAAERAKKEEQRAVEQAAKLEERAIRDGLRKQISERNKSAKDAAKAEQQAARAAVAAWVPAWKKIQEQANAAAKAAEKAQKLAARPRDAFGNLTRGGDRGLRQISSSRAFQDMFGKTAAQLAGLQGPMGQAAAMFGLFRSGIALASSALSTFASYVMNDVMRLLKEGARNQQIANRAGGGVSSGQVAGVVSSLYKSNPLLSRDQAQEVAEKAFIGTKDAGKAKDVAELASQANVAYGTDAVKMAQVLSAKRMEYSGMSSEDFKRMMGSEIATSSKLGVTDPAALVGGAKLNNMASKFAITAPGGATNYSAMAGVDMQMSALVAKATEKGATGTNAIGGLNHLLNDLARNKIGTYKGTGILRPLSETLPDLVAKTNGDLSALGPGAKKGKMLGEMSLGGGFSQQSIDFIRSLGLDKSGKELQEIFDKAKDASALANDAKKVESDSGFRVQAAFRTLEAKVMDSLAPVLEQQGPKIADAIGAMVDGLKDVDLVGTFKMVTQGIAGLLYGLMSIMPDSIAKKFGGEKTKAALRKAAGIEETETSSEVAGSLPQRANAKLANDIMLGQAKGPSALASFMGVNGGAGAQNVGASMALNDIFASQRVLTATEGGKSNVVGPPRADHMMPAANKLAAAADKLASAADVMILNDPARTTALPGQTGVK